MQVSDWAAGIAGCPGGLDGNEERKAPTKPNPANFEYMLDRLRGDFGLDAPDILHTAQSLFHDHVPARAFGLANAWIDRQGLSEGGDWGATAVVGEKPQFDFLFPDMASMARAVIADRGQQE